MYLPLDCDTLTSQITECKIGLDFDKSVLGPIYTIANMQRIRIHPFKLEFSLDKISSDSKRLHCKGTKDNQTLVTFVTGGNLSGLSCLHECKYGAYRNLFNYSVNLSM